MKRIRAISKAPVRAQSWPIDVKLQFAFNFIQLLIPFVQDKEPQNSDNNE